VKIVIQADNPCIQLFDSKDAKDAFQELPLQPAYSVSDVAHQVFDQVKDLFYLEHLTNSFRPGGLVLG
jgi:hypothetical protein